MKKYSRQIEADFIRRLPILFLFIIIVLSSIFVLASCADKSDGGGGHVHEYVESVVEPTCTEQGYTLHRCECGDEYKDAFTVGSHEYTPYYSSSGCNAEESYLFKFCEKCGYVETENDVVHPHSYVFMPEQDPTCTKCGVSYWIKCERCGYSPLKMYTPALGHRLTGVYIDNGNNHYRVCQRSACRQNVYSPHRYGTPIVKAGTCTRKGEIYAVCRDCGHRDVTELAESHRMKLDEIITKATCTTTGSARYKCVLCSKTEMRIIPVLGHNWGNYEVIVAASCHVDGTGMYTCSRCGVTKTVTIEKGHKFGAWSVIKQPTCTEDGQRKRTCSVCGEIQSETVPMRHTWNNGEEITPATCEDAGEKLYTCTVCGVTEIRAIKALGHDETELTEEPTCTEGGFTAKVCSRCGKIIEIIEAVPPLGHDLEYAYDANKHWQRCMRDGCNYKTAESDHEIETTVVTEKSGGEYLHKLVDMCEICGYEEKVRSIIHEHYAVQLIKETVTCIHDGLSAGLKCGVSGCDEILIEPTPVSALGHKYIDGKCVRCGAIDYDLFQTVGLEYSLNEHNNTYTLTGLGTATDTDIVIARTHNGLPVKLIDSNAFEDSNITSVIISDYVEGIGNNAFFNCSRMTSITIPTSVTSICNNAFDGCSSLTSIAIPTSVTSIENRTFFYCYGLTSVIIPNSVTYIGSEAFAYCNSLTSIAIPNSVIRIEGSAFSGCNGLTSVIIPNSVMCIDGGAFAYCSGLIGAIISNSVTCIEDNTFAYCSSLTSIEIPNSVTRIESGAFAHCCSLASIEIPNSITSIGDRAFDGCLNLMSVNIPNSVTRIEDGIFTCCRSLTSIEIPNSVTSIENSAFYGCSGLISITIQNNVTSIGNHTFYGCSSLTSITFNGTKAQWNAISKDDNWDSNTGNYTIHCTDGDIEKSVE